MISFADSTTPALIPSAFTHVAAYPDGLYKWPASQLGRFPAHIEISVTTDPMAAAYAREKDLERGDASAPDFPPFAEQRYAEGHDDPTAYSSILGPGPGFGLVALFNAMQAAAFTRTWRLHLAWWWGRPFPPTAGECIAEIFALTKRTLPPNCDLWACQWQNGTNYDTSVLYGRDDFTRSTP